MAQKSGDRPREMQQGPEVDRASTRVNFEVTPLKPFSSLAFPILPKAQTPLKQPGFGDELVTGARAAAPR
jgi:hypothetical protein